MRGLHFIFHDPVWWRKLQHYWSDLQHLTNHCSDLRGWHNNGERRIVTIVKAIEIFKTSAGGGNHRNFSIIVRYILLSKRVSYVETEGSTSGGRWMTPSGRKFSGWRWSRIKNLTFRLTSHYYKLWVWKSM